MKQFYSFILILSFSISYAQVQQLAPWNENTSNRKGSKATLAEISNKAEQYFNTIDRDKKGSGLKPFKRWEYHWSHYLNNNGDFITAKDLWNSWEQKKSLSTISQNRKANLSDWKPLGPFTNSNTYSTSGLKQTGQGRVNSIAVDPNNSNTYYVGAPAGGIWKSTDAGLNWIPLTDNLPQIGVSGIAIDPTNSDVIYIATGDDDANDSFAVGVWKSIDGGSTWNNTGAIPGNPDSMNEIYIDPTNPQIILVATETGVQKSINGGTSWVTKLSRNIIDLKMKPGDPTTWYATSSNTFYRSTDSGETFSSVTIAGFFGSTRITMDVTEADPNYVYFVSAGGSNAFNGIYKSTDSGASFTKTSETSDIFRSTQAWYDLALTVSSVNKDIVYVGVLDIWKSVNGGDSFTQLNQWNNPNTPTYTHADIHFLRFIDGKFFAGTDGGIYVSTNEGNLFTDLTKTLAISQFYRISVSPTKLDVVAGGLQDNGGYGFDGKDWRNYHGGDGMEGLVDPNNSNIYYGFTQYGGSLNITNDQGKSGSSSINAPSSETGANDSGGKWITPLSINKEGELFAGFSKLYKLVNGSWSRVHSSPFANFGGDLDRVVIDPNNSDIMFFSRGSSLFKSTDRGVTFSPITFSQGSISSIEISKNSSDIAWIVSQNGVFKSSNFTDASPTFTDITLNLPSERKLVITHHLRSGKNTVYLGTNLGVYFINDDLTEWETFDTNLPNVQIRDLDINEEDSKLYAGTYGRGLFSTDIPTVLPQSDVRLLSINNISNIVNCGVDVNPEITIKNQGQLALTAATITYNINGGTNSVFNWTGNLASEKNVSVILPSITGSFGNQVLNVEVNTTDDSYSTNNKDVAVFSINNKNSSPTDINTFENTSDQLLVETSNSEMWTILNSDKSLLNIPSGNAAYSTSPGQYPTGTTGYLYTNCYNLSEISNPTLKFDMGFDIEQDWDYMVVEYSKDQGSSWDILGSSSDPNWYNSNATLNGLPGRQWTGEGNDINPTDGQPNSSNREYTHSLSAFASETSIMFRFKFISDANTTGEGAIIDNLVVQGVLSTGDETFLKGISIYPNPSESIFNINRNTNDNLTIKVFDLTGKQVFFKKNIQETNYRIDLSNYAKGIYVMNMSSNGKSATKKLILK